jgi:hypothetical protein
VAAMAIAPVLLWLSPVRRLGAPAAAEGSA